MRGPRTEAGGASPSGEAQPAGERLSRPAPAGARARLVGLGRFRVGRRLVVGVRVGARLGVGVWVDVGLGTGVGGMILAGVRCSRVLGSCGVAVRAWLEAEELDPLDPHLEGAVLDAVFRVASLAGLALDKDLVALLELA